MARTRRSRRPRSEPAPPQEVKDAKYAARKALEDAIEEYAKAYAAFCMKLAGPALTDRMQQRIYDAIDTLERVLVPTEE